MENIKIANSWNLWREYMDTNGEMTEADFDALTSAERVTMVNDCFGRDYPCE